MIKNIYNYFLYLTIIGHINMFSIIILITVTNMFYYYHYS